MHFEILTPIIQLTLNTMLFHMDVTVSEITGLLTAQTSRIHDNQHGFVSDVICCIEQSAELFF